MLPGLQTLVQPHLVVDIAVVTAVVGAVVVVVAANVEIVDQPLHFLQLVPKGSCCYLGQPSVQQPSQTLHYRSRSS